MSHILNALGAPTRAEREMLAQLLEEVRRIRLTSTDLMARFTSGTLNGVLEVTTETFDTNGRITRQYHTPCGSLLVINPVATAVTVAAAAPAQTTPDKGVGVMIVNAYSWLAIPIGGRSWTAYGTAGNKLSIQAFTGLQALGVIQ